MSNKLFRNLDSYQEEIGRWVMHVFGTAQLRHVPLRAIRALEECVEANQSCYVPREIAHQIVDAVYDRPVEPDVGKEIGGSLFTMLALAEACGLPADQVLDRTIKRGWDPERIKQIQERNKGKIFIDDMETLKHGR